MTCNLINYNWSIETETSSLNVSGKAYITKEDSIFNDFVLYFLYAPDGRFVSSYWSESEARIAAASRGMECEEKTRPAMMSLPRTLDFEAAQGLIL